MASIASDSTTHPVAAQALQGLEQGRRLLLNTFKYVPEDKLNQMIAQAGQLDMQHLSLKEVITIVLKSQPQLLLETLPYFIGM